MDTVGALARAAADVRSLLAVIAGFDPADPTSSRRPLVLDGADDVRRLRVGVVEALVDAADPGGRVLRRVGRRRARRARRDALEGGAPGLGGRGRACGRLIRGEALAVYGEALARRPELLEEGTRRRLALAAADLEKGELESLRHARARWAERVEATFHEVDLLLLPTIPGEAPLANSADTVKTTATVVPYTFLIAFAHVPALSLPCGTTPNGAPVGVQLAAAPWKDGLALRACAAVQAARTGIVGGAATTHPRPAARATPDPPGSPHREPA